MKTKYTNSIIDILQNKTNKVIFHMWGGENIVALGDGVRFKVTRSSTVDYVYIKYLGGFNEFEVEFGALVGMEYDVLDRVWPISSKELISVISKKILGIKVASHHEIENF